MKLLSTIITFILFLSVHSIGICNELSQEDEISTDKIEQIGEVEDGFLDNEKESESAEEGHKFEPLKDNLEFKYLIISALVIGRWNTFGLYSIERAVSATIAIYKVASSKSLNWKQKMSGIGYYSRQYGYLAAYLLVGKLYENRQSASTTNGNSDDSYSHEGGTSQSSERSSSYERGTSHGAERSSSYERGTSHGAERSSSYGGRTSQGAERPFFAPRAQSQRSRLFSQMQKYAPNVQVTQDDDGFRKLYYRAALKHHPDRGGDAEVFKTINELNQQYSNL